MNEIPENHIDPNNHSGSSASASQKKNWFENSSKKLLVGFIAGIGLTAFGLGLRLFAGVPFPAEKLYNAATYWLGTPVMFQLVHKLLGFGEAGKIFAFGGVLVAWLGGLTVLGLVSPLISSVIVLVACVAILFTVGPIWALLHAGLYLALRFGLVPIQEQAAKRGTLRTLGWGSFALFGAGAFSVVRPLFNSTAAISPTDVVAGSTLLPGITPVNDFYYVSINNEALDPKINASKWQLEVGGLVKNPQSFELDVLKSDFQAKNLEYTFSCISNPVGGDLIGNAIWTGLSFKDLIQKVGVQPGAKWVTIEAADGFYESLPLAELLEDDVLLAYSQNGKALNFKHGFPLRVLVPGRYGMKQPRWITKITFSATEKPGYWANRGWSKTAYIMTMSRIDFPRQDQAVKKGATLELRGVAFAGKKAITKVEISTDDGQTWLEASLTAPRSKHAWTIWRLPWIAVGGRRGLVVRAYADGVVQESKVTDSLPEAASGLHQLFIDVA